VSWQGKRVLVTGAGGFIGSHLTERLVQEGAAVRAFVHYNALGRAGWLDQRSSGADIMAGDVCDRDSVRHAVEGTEVVFHLAALIGIPYSYQAPLQYVRTNVEGTLNVLQACREAGVGRLVHTSTSEVYGTARTVPISEDHPLHGQSPYAATKIGADKLAESFHVSFGLPLVTVRPFNTFGPRQSARAIIPTIIAQALAGGVVQVGNVHPTRDLNYVSNTVDGFLKAAEAPQALGRTYNLGSGREVSVADLGEMVARVLGRPVRLERDPSRVRPAGSEVERLLADASRAREELGWQPQVMLEEGLARTVDWIRDNAERYRVDAYVV
jgi:NAD dependent epimerase/dehydratase